MSRVQNLRLKTQTLSQIYTDMWITYLGQQQTAKDLHKIKYEYDDKGNIKRINTTNYKLQDFSSDQHFAYDTADQLDTAYAYNHNNGALYNVKMVYGNYGRIKTSNTTFTDPKEQNALQTHYNNYMYNTVNPASNSFAPMTANDTINFEFGINGSLRKRGTENKAEYYHFNAFDQMKAYSDDGIKYGYYGYDDAGQRMYKVTLNSSEIYTSRYGGTTLYAEKMMLYPNGYINIDHHGNYTKHYYADAARVASKIGSGYEDTISTGLADTTHLLATMKNELGILLTGDTVDNIVYNFKPITHLQGDTTSSYEDALFFYHGNHLSSTQLITDNSGSISQAVLYTPFGQVISEYRQDWKLDTIPRFLFNGKELDEESGLIDYGKRLLDPKFGGFISRDKYFEKFWWISPYAYCANNPVKYIDPDGNFPIPMHAEMVSKVLSKTNLPAEAKRLIIFGASIYADAMSKRDIHFDNKPNFTSCVEAYVLAAFDYVSGMRSGDYIRAGEGLHAIADFYSHSNYIPLYRRYAMALSMDVNDIPTFQEVLKNPDLSGFLDMLKKELKTGTFGDGNVVIELIKDKRSKDENSHGRRNLDSPDSPNGKMPYNCSGETLHDAAAATGEKAIDQIVNGN